MFDYFTLLNELRGPQVCTVVFTKADGTERTMAATLNFSNIPEEHFPKSGGDGNLSEFPDTETADPDLIKCYDVEAKGWRSFKVSAVSSFSHSS